MLCWKAATFQQEQQLSAAFKKPSILLSSRALLREEAANPRKDENRLLRTSAPRGSTSEATPNNFPREEN